MKFLFTTLYKSNLWKILFTISFIALNSSLSAQRLVPTSILKTNNLGSSPNFYQIQRAMEDYWDSKSPMKVSASEEEGEDGGAPGWALYKRWEYYWEQRINIKTGEFPKTNSVIEYQAYKQQNKPTYNNLKSAQFSESWSNLGTNSSDGGYAGIGRINCIAFHPTDANTFWVGSPSGGIWKTTDGGTSWTILNNSEDILGVSAIAIPSDYVTTNTIYIATGDRDLGSMWSLGGGQASYADNTSIGVLKSTDGGATWNATGLSFAKNLGKIIYSLHIDPINNSELFAATSDGILKSTDGGASWNNKTVNVWGDIEFKPGDHTIMYASSVPYGGTYINRSTDNGETWSIINSGSPVANNGRRGEIAVSPNDPAVVYLLAANSGGGVEGIYKSTNSGASFTVVNNGNPGGMCGYYTDGSGGTSGQGSYDLCIAVDPSEANTVFIGGITIWKSTDGGVNFNAINNWVGSSTYNKSGVAVVHADHHVLAYQNSSSTLFDGNDGGIYKTTNGGTSYTDLTNGMVISQIYRLSTAQANASIVLSGLQDNGSKLYNAGFWSDVTGGDGMECIIDYSNSNYMYATYVRGVIYRSTDGANFTTTISANIGFGQPTGAWVTPYVIDQNNSSTLFAGYDKVWKTTDRGDSWLSASQTLSSVVKLRSLAIAPSNSSILYAADQTNMWKTTDGGITNWSIIPLPFTSTSVTYIAVSARDPSVLWITYGGYSSGNKIYQSTDAGANWTNISGSLPNLPVMCVAQNKRIMDQYELVVGTDLGVYVKDGINDWASFNTGLPNVVVTDLQFYYDAANSSNDKLRASTFGRGMWETSINPPSVLAKVKIFLEGSYADHDTMHAHLNYSKVLQNNVLSQPYSGSPFTYGGGESVTSSFLNSNLDIVDWIILELRDGGTPTTIKGTRSAFIKKDGSIVDMDGTSPVRFYDVFTGSYYIVVIHRNHLAVMSANAVSLPNSSAYTFTNGNTLGTNAMKDFGDGNYGMYAGDANSSGIITNSDKDPINSNLNAAGYYNEDVNMSGIVTNADKDKINENINKSSQVSN